MKLEEVECSNPLCKTKVLRKSHDGLWRFKTMALRVAPDGTGMVAVCKFCKSETAVPYYLSAPSGLQEPLVKGGGSVVKSNTGARVVTKKNP